MPGNDLFCFGKNWALLSIFGKLIYTSESTCFENKMAVCFHELTDEESIVKRRRELPARFFSPFSATTESEVNIQEQI